MLELMTNTMNILFFFNFLVFQVHSWGGRDERDGCGISHIHKYGNRIVGGREALSGEFPWMVSLQSLHLSDMGYHHFCGATILDKHWILTAAHCVDSLDPESIKIVVGTNYISQNQDLGKRGAHYDVNMIVYHGQFRRSGFLNDIALLKINGEIKFNAAINRICLPEDHYYLGGLVTTTGWGRISSSGPKSTVLLAVDLPVTTQEYCRKKYGSNKISNTVFCAGTYPEMDSCSGDSGGPVIQIEDNRAIIVGIISYGSNICGRNGWPGVYTQVSQYIDWIYDNMYDNIEMLNN